MRAGEQLSAALDRLVRLNGDRSPARARTELVSALERVAGVSTRPGTAEIDSVMDRLVKEGNLAWSVASTYSSILRNGHKLPTGMVFTPPSLVEAIVERLRPGVPVVDFGAGTGMLSLAAALRGFNVTAVESDPELVRVLALLRRIHRVDENLTVVHGDALYFKGDHDSQIMSNPPYSRHHALLSSQKEALGSLARGLGAALPATAGHYAYFMLHAWKATWSQREILLVPTNWLETKYGAPLRDILAHEKSFSISVADHRQRRSAFAPNLTTTCIVVTERRSEGAASLDRGVWNSLILGADRRAAHIPSTAGLVRELRDRTNVLSNREGQTECPLRRYLRVHRGIATGANSFFVLSDEEAVELGLQSNELVPILRTLSPRPGRESLGLLWAPKGALSAASKNRIRQGVELQLHQRSLCKARTPWWQIKLAKPPSYFLSYMGRRQPKLEVNVNGLVNLNNTHGLYVADGASKEMADRIVTWLTTEAGQTALITQARHYQGGLWKLEPSDIENLDVSKAVAMDDELTLARVAS